MTAPYDAARGELLARRLRHTGMRLLAVVALALAAACGNVTTGSLGTSPSPVVSVTPSPEPSRSPAPAATPRPTPASSAGTTVVTDGDSGRTVRLRLGQRLEVRLSQGTWDPPVSSADGVVVRRSSRGGYPSSQPVDAIFEAVAKGAADVTAQTDAACFHTEPRCLMPVRLWVVHVSVT